MLFKQYGLPAVLRPGSFPIALSASLLHRVLHFLSINHVFTGLTFRGVVNQHFGEKHPINDLWEMIWTAVQIS